MPAGDQMVGPRSLNSTFLRKVSTGGIAGTSCPSLSELADTYGNASESKTTDHNDLVKLITPLIREYFGMSEDDQMDLTAQLAFYFDKVVGLMNDKTFAYGKVPIVALSALFHTNTGS